MAQTRSDSNSGRNFATEAIIRVGGGRGFLLENRHIVGWRATLGHVVLTAAHCLPYLPPPTIASDASERMYDELLAPLDDGGRPASCECLCVDPRGAVAVLGQPGPQGAPEDISIAYEELMENRSPLRLGTGPDLRNSSERDSQVSIPVWLVTLNGRWVECTAQRHPRLLVIDGPPEAGAFGTSGSPILIEDGSVIGVVNTGGESESEHLHTIGTLIADSLPKWILDYVLTREEN
jgi:hypothetical protein